MAAALTITGLFDSLAIQLDGKRAWASTASIRWHFTDSGESYRMELSNGALIHHPTSRTEPADVVITLTRARLLAMLGGGGRRLTTLRRLPPRPRARQPTRTPGFRISGQCQNRRHCGLGEPAVLGHRPLQDPGDS